MAFIYRFIAENSAFKNNQETVYIGSTIHDDLDDRLKTHNHKNKSIYQSVIRIDYTEVPTPTDARMIELYLINKYNPRYNVRDTFAVLPLWCTVDESRLDWRTWETCFDENGHYTSINGIEYRLDKLIKGFDETG